MKNQNNSIEDLRTIRKMMEESTRFLSLSGLSGIFAGILAITGAVVSDLIVRRDTGSSFDHLFGNPAVNTAGPTGVCIIIAALSVLFLSATSSFLLSIRKARKENKSFWSPVSKRVLSNLFIPMAAGGIFSVILIIYGNLHLIIPTTLIFYGMALISASKFTYGETFYLGLAEMITGFAAGFFPATGLIFWTSGFGIFHIIYGIVLYRKYEA